MKISVRPLRGLWVRAAIAAAFALSMAAAIAPAHAGPGHAGDEGHDHGAAGAASSQSPRVVATSEAYQLVGISKAGKLTIYLDREPDNLPVTAAKITVSVGGKSAAAVPATNGTYEFPADDLVKSGDHELQFTIAADGKTDLLAGVLTVPGQPNAAAGQAKANNRMAQVTERLRRVPVWVAGLLVFGLGIGAGSLLSRNRVATAAASLALALAVACGSVDPAAAGPGHAGDEGHAHGPEQGAGLSDQASRLPDGSVFLPKPTQRLLEVRTRLIDVAQASRVVTLPGKVISSTNGPVVEVALYDQLSSDAIRAAHAVGPGGTKAALQGATRSAELKNNATMLTFPMSALAPASLRAIGQRVSVLLETGEPVKGTILPRAAIVTAPNGQSVVFEHTEAERFTPKLVLFSPIDADRVVVTSGLAAGDKIVIEAASLINQVR